MTVMMEIEKSLSPTFHPEISNRVLKIIFSWRNLEFSLIFAKQRKTFENLNIYLITVLKTSIYLC